MKDNKKILKGILILGIIGIVILVTMYYSEKYKGVVNKFNKSTFKNITAIQYQEVKETYGQGDGKNIKTSNITYVYPDKLRIETNGSAKRIEIYNHNKYIYYDSESSIIKTKECFPPDKPYITEIEKKMVNILDKGEYEFFGYEEKDQRRMEIIGIKSKMDGHSYMHKLWISDFNGVVLPTKEEYFIDNIVVSKTTYSYQKVNEAISPKQFEIESLPDVEVKNDGYLPKFFDNVEGVGKYITFKPVIPTDLPQGFITSEVSITPPIKNPILTCIYFKEGYRIYLRESSPKSEFTPNASLGKLPCYYERVGNKVAIKWNQNGISINISGDMEILNEIVSIAETISGGNLVKNQYIN